jgi:hypothetical protein
LAPRRRVRAATEPALQRVETRQQPRHIVRGGHPGQAHHGHLEHREGLRRPGQVLLLLHQSSEHAPQPSCVAALGELAQLGALFVAALDDFLRVGRDAQHDEVAQQLQEVRAESLCVHTGVAGVRARGQGARGVAVDTGIQNGQQEPSIDQVQHLGHLLVGHLGTAVGDQLVEQRLGIAHRAVGLACDGEQARIRNLHLLGRADQLEPVDDLSRADAAQVVALAARHHGEGDLLRVGRREDEEALRRRLLECLEQRVEGRRREHVHLVHHEDPVLARGSRVADRRDHLAHVIDAGAARRVDLLHVGRVARRDLATRCALVARCVGGALVAVQAARQDARQRRLAHAARPGEQDGVRDAIAADGVAQRRRNVGLADDLVETLGAPLARQRRLAHAARPGEQDGVRDAIAADGVAQRRRNVAKGQSAPPSARPPDARRAEGVPRRTACPRKRRG